MNETIAIVVVATNAYCPLGSRFIRRFHEYYTGSRNIRYYFFSDRDPSSFLPEEMDIRYIETKHDSWVDATNSKFTNILSIQDAQDLDYIYYFDADTNVSKPFTEDWCLGEVAGGEHFLNKEFNMKNSFPYDRNPESKCYIPLDTPHEKMYYYGAFFGGKKERVHEFCATLKENQEQDKLIPYEPGVNDESYINHYFHHNPPKTIMGPDFPFHVSCKGGLNQDSANGKDTRNPNLDVEHIMNALMSQKGRNFNFHNGNVVFE